MLKTFSEDLIRFAVEHAQSEHPKESCGVFSEDKYIPFENTKPCLNQTQIRCANLAYGEFTDSDIAQDCQSTCPLECDSTELDTFVT